eukprot:TRINITY_DN9314_c0_g4_i1.p3 TRINITY_DN9314_c0_g4~~TRINITY_DN9314_c0_g4_i1.p3  ORF type:complete len:112 (-),score=27.18 TRINITY_DN9314_c0_g4_i1:491-826(-)
MSRRRWRTARTKGRSRVVRGAGAEAEAGAGEEEVIAEIGDTVGEVIAGTGIIGAEEHIIETKIEIRNQKVFPLICVEEKSEAVEEKKEERKIKGRGAKYPNRPNRLLSATL